MSKKNKEKEMYDILIEKEEDCLKKLETLKIATKGLKNVKINGKEVYTGGNGRNTIKNE